jgi:uncharacterized membrane protein
MNMKNYAVPFFVVLAIVALLVVSPALSRVLVFPRTEFFTEIWILGPSHMTEDYPFNIFSGQSYSVTLGIGNQLGYCAYYLVEVKFLNESQSAPSGFALSPSLVSSLFNVTAFVADQTTWEMPLTLSFNFVSNVSLLRVDFRSMVLNGVALGLNGLSESWNASRNMFPGDLVFELWLFNSTENSFQYHQRFVYLWLNMTG